MDAIRFVILSETKDMVVAGKKTEGGISYMNATSLSRNQRLPFAEWLIVSLVFWVVLACGETVGALFMNSIPAPIGKGTLPTAIDLDYLIAALSIYALLSITAGLALWGSETALSWLRKKTGHSFWKLNRMDMVLLFGFGLLCFKWISNLMAYLVKGNYLPLLPYLLIVPLLVVYAGITSLLKKTPRYYLVHWVCMVLGAIFLSKTGYDVYIGSSAGVVAKGVVFVLFVLGALALSFAFYYLLNLVLSKGLNPNLASVSLLIILLSGGLLFTLSAWLSRHHPEFPSPTVSSQREGHTISKNVIIVLVDCLRADHLGCYGYRQKTSPFLDLLAPSGILFENCIAPSSWTIPSVVSLFTGVYAPQHGVNELGSVIPEDLATFQEVMGNGGVKTAAFITNDFLRPRFGYARGFTHYVDHYLEPEFKEYVASRLFFLNALLYFKNVFFYPTPVDPGGTRWWSVGFPPFNHGRQSAGRVTDDVLRWIHIYRDIPFYLYLHYMDVHSPYDTTCYPLLDGEAYDSQDEREKLANTYDGRVVYVDQQIKRIWEELVALNIAENTLLIITADHGEEIYDHGGTGHCTTLYEELIRVPLMMIHPSVAEKGRRINKQVSLIDVPTTVLRFLGLPVPGQMEGESLLPLIQGNLLAPDAAYALSYTTRGRKSLRTDEGRALWEKKVWDQGIILESLRVDNEWKLIVGSDGSNELYNLKEDAREKNDARKGSQAKADALREALREESSRLKRYGSTREKIELSPDAKNKLRALGYL